MVEPFENLFSLLVFHLDHFQRVPYQAETPVVIIDESRTSLVMPRAKMLDLLARILDLGQAERRRGPFQEVAE